MEQLNKASFHPENINHINRRTLLSSIAGAFLVGSKGFAGQSKQVRHTYDPTDEIFCNPDRGFHASANPPGGGIPGQQDQNHPPLIVDDLRTYRDQPEAMTLLRLCIIIPSRFWKKSIDNEFLSEIQASFDAARVAGIKLIPRFLYDWGMTNRDPDESTIRRHLDELAPLIHRNIDVAAWYQTGLFGGTGEGNASDSGHIEMNHRIGEMDWHSLSKTGIAIMKHWLDVLPTERMLTVRYPRLKWDLFGWDSRVAMAKALTQDTSFTGRGPARIGIMNDGFMGSETHYAMFVLQNEMEFAAQDTGYTVSEGEISDATEWKLKSGRVLQEMEKLHQTALNRDGDDWDLVSTAWRANGDYQTIARRMGYRLRLIDSELFEYSAPNRSARLKVTMVNEGFGRVLNPRDLVVVYRSNNHELHRQKFDFGYGNRKILPGPGDSSTIEFKLEIPPMQDAPTELLLHLPDPSPSISARPEYAIRLANKGIWEAETGYHRLGYFIDP
jgi:hypothetical protein